MLHRIFDTLEHRPRVLSHFFTFVLIVTGVVLSNARAGLMALVVGVAVYGLLMTRTRQAKIDGIVADIESEVAERSTEARSVETE